MKPPEGNHSERGELLVRHLQERIAGGGPISFAEFMQDALYHPALGYYAGSELRIGTRGDYFTSVSATRLFGRLLARCLAEWRDHLAEGPFTVYEFGAHRGQLRDDILSEVPDLDYRTLEFDDPFPESMQGCVLSNELLDALPCHRVKVVNGRWCEQLVGPGTEGAPFAWHLGSLSAPELEEILAPLPVAWMEGYETEISLMALRWMRRVGERLRAGFVLSIDYGHDTVDYFAPRRAKGGLRCYYRHQLGDDPFVRVGEQDITADVDFGSLIRVGEESGLEVVEFTDQSHFLLRRGADLIRQIIERDAGQLSAERNAVHLLTHPQFLGAPFKVLLQRKRREPVTTGLR